MIKNLYTNSDWVTVNQQNTAMPWINTTQPMAGMLRVNNNMNRVEVYDGLNWQGMSSDAHVDLSATAKETLAWARLKMEEERRIRELMNRHPGLKDLHDKFEMMKALCLEQEQETQK